MSKINDPFGLRDKLSTAAGEVWIYRLDRLEAAGVGAVSRLPFTIKVLLEAALRNLDGYLVSEDDAAGLAGWNAAAATEAEVPFMPARVVLQDFTGVPSLVDLAALRSAMARMGKDPRRIEPRIPADLVIDHSVQVDRFARRDALRINAEIEFDRNRERYEFLRWGGQCIREVQGRAARHGNRAPGEPGIPGEGGLCASEASRFRTAWWERTRIPQ